MDIYAGDVASKCKKDFSCLNVESRDCCEVTDCVNGEILFVKNKYKPCCLYQEPFGSEFTCNCPVRKKLFEKYKI